MSFVNCDSLNLIIRKYDPVGLAAEHNEARRYCRGIMQGVIFCFSRKTLLIWSAIDGGCTIELVLLRPRAVFGGVLISLTELANRAREYFLRP